MSIKRLKFLKSENARVEKFNNWYEKIKIKSLEGFNGRFELTSYQTQGRSDSERIYSKWWKEKTLVQEFYTPQNCPPKVNIKTFPVRQRLQEFTAGRPATEEKLHIQVRRHSGVVWIHIKGYRAAVKATRRTHTKDGVFFPLFLTDLKDNCIKQ